MVIFFWELQHMGVITLYTWKSMCRTMSPCQQKTWRHIQWGLMKSLIFNGGPRSPCLQFGLRNKKQQIKTFPLDSINKLSDKGSPNKSFIFQLSPVKIKQSFVVMSASWEVVSISVSWRRSMDDMTIKQKKSLSLYLKCLSLSLFLSLFHVLCLWIKWWQAVVLRMM